MEKLKFPAKTSMFFGSGGDDPKVVKERKDTLNLWMNGVLSSCRGDKNVAMFLAQDGSVSDAMNEEIGLGSYTPGSPKKSFCIFYK